MTITVLPVSTSRLQHVDQPARVGEVQAGSGLVEDVESAPGGALGKLSGQLDALRLTAGQRGGRLAHADVAESYLDHRAQLASDRGDVGEELGGLLDGHGEHVGNGLALVLNL